MQFGWPFLPARAKGLMMRIIKQVVKTGKYLEKVSQEKINELVVKTPELVSAVKSFLAIKATDEGASESKLNDPLINKLKLALNFYDNVSELEVQIRGGMEGIMVEPLDKLLGYYSEEEYTQLAQGSMFCKTLEYYRNNYPDLREGLAKILDGRLLTAEERTELISTAKIAINLGDYLQTIEPKTLALHMRQNSEIHKLVENLSVLKLAQKLEEQLSEVIKIYNLINDIDNDQELAEVLNIELSEIPAVKVIEDNTAQEDKPTAEWLEEQFINNKPSPEENSWALNDEEAELEAKEKGVPDLVPEYDSSQVDLISVPVNEVAPIGELTFSYEAA